MIRVSGICWRVKGCLPPCFDNGEEEDDKNNDDDNDDDNYDAAEDDDDNGVDNIYGLPLCKPFGR